MVVRWVDVGSLSWLCTQERLQLEWHRITFHAGPVPDTSRAHTHTHTHTRASVFETCETHMLATGSLSHTRAVVADGDRLHEHPSLLNQDLWLKMRCIVETGRVISVILAWLFSSC